MAQITLKGNAINTNGELPAIGTEFPAYSFVQNDLSEINTADLKGNKLIINIFPSIDTGTCATSVRTFNKEAANLPNTKILCISHDLPFALKRFCGAEGIENVITASAFRSDFAQKTGLLLIDGGLKGLIARSIIVLDENGKILHTELVPETVNEPNYQAALAVL
jgi:thioredoxin-dependent peroxiredoxin